MTIDITFIVRCLDKNVFCSSVSDELRWDCINDNSLDGISQCNNTLSTKRRQVMRQVIWVIRIPKRFRRSSFFIYCLIFKNWVCRIPNIFAVLNDCRTVVFITHTAETPSEVSTIFADGLCKRIEMNSVFRFVVYIPLELPFGVKSQVVIVVIKEAMSYHYIPSFHKLMLSKLRLSSDVNFIFGQSFSHCLAKLDTIKIRLMTGFLIKIFGSLRVLFMM